MRRARSEPGSKTVVSSGATSGAIGGREGGRSKDKKGPLGGTPRLVVPARLRLVDFGVGAELWVLVNNAARSCWKTCDCVVECQDDGNPGAYLHTYPC